MRADGSLVFNTVTPILDMAVAGLGLAYMAEDLVQAHVADGRLVRVLDDWSPPFRVIIFIDQAVAILRRPLRCWLMHFATEELDALRRNLDLCTTLKTYFALEAIQQSA